MREARLHGIRDLRVRETPKPERGPGESLVRVTAVGLCGSDLHWFEAGRMGDVNLAAPLVLGHEFGGFVEEGELTGHRVAVDPAIPCTICDRCREGNTNLCPTGGFAGHQDTDGGLREYVTWPTHLLHTVPVSFTDTETALLEPLGVAVHTLRLGRVRRGTKVAIIGCGPIGLLLVQVSRAAGCEPVIAIEPLAHRRAMAAKLGADIVFNIDWDAEDIADSADVAFEVAGTSRAVAYALQLARPGGRVVLAGIPADDTITLAASLARRKGLSIIFARRMRDTFKQAELLIRQGQVDVESIVSHKFPLTEAGNAFTTAANRSGLKTIVVS